MAEIDEDVMNDAWRMLSVVPSRTTFSRADVAAYIARAIMAERERCASVADDLQYSADATFNDLTKRARNGEKHLELAVAAAAGMSHQARKATAAIRKGEHHDQA